MQRGRLGISRATELPNKAIAGSLHGFQARRLVSVVVLRPVNGACHGPDVSRLPAGGQLLRFGSHWSRRLCGAYSHASCLPLSPAADLLPVCHFDAQVRPCLCAAGLTVHAEAQGSSSPIDATLLEDVMSFRILSIA